MESRLQRPLRLLPQLDLHKVHEDYRGSCVTPNPWIHMEGRLPGSDTVVVLIDYGISPLNDRIYVDGLKVAPGYQKQGYARSMLQTLSILCQTPGHPLMPVTPLQEVESAWSFWDDLRADNIPHLIVTRELAICEMVEEKQRWICAISH